MKKTTLIFCASAFASIMGGSALSAAAVYVCPQHVVCFKYQHPGADYVYGCNGDASGTGTWEGTINIPGDNRSFPKYGPRNFELPISRAAVEDLSAYCLYQGYNNTIHVALTNRRVDSRCTSNKEGPTGFNCP